MYLDPREPYVLVNQEEARALLRALGCDSSYGFLTDEYRRFLAENAGAIVSQLQKAAHYAE